MGFWSKLFGKADAASSGTVAREELESRPEAEAPAAQASVEPAAAEMATESVPPAPEQVAGPEGGVAQPQTCVESASTPPAAPEPAQESDAVDYLLTTHDAYPVAPQFQATKKVYRANSREAAIAFLKTQAVTQPLFYIEVQTPDGVLAIDEGRRLFDGEGRFIEAAPE